MSQTKKNKPPYPRIGEIYRCLANAFDTRSSASDGHSRSVDKLAREADFDYALLSESAEKLFREPLGKQTNPEIANAVADFVERFIRDYSGLVAAIPLDSIDREEALPLLIKHLFASCGAAFLLFARQAWGGPELMSLLNPGTQPIAAVLGWFGTAEVGLGVDWIGALYPGSTDEHKRMRDLIGKWRRGTDLPTLQSLGLLGQGLQENWPKKGEVIANLKRWLLVARALSWFEREAAGYMSAGITVRALVTQELLMGVPRCDVRMALLAKVQEAAQSMQEIKVAGLTLMEGLRRTVPKQVGDQARLSAALKVFEKLLAEHDPQGRSRYLLHWARARWQVLSGCLADALPDYEAAFDAALYRAGPNQKEIFQELLVVAARLGSNRPVLKRIKNQALAFGFFKASMDSPILEDWEVAQFSGKFAQVFPPQGRFVEVLESSEHEYLPFLVFDQSGIESLEPDISKPNRILGLRGVDGQVLRRPQLSAFVSFGQTEKVRQLIAAGAPVDQQDATGGSALLAAIQRFENNGDRGVLDLLLEQSHQKDTLDSATHRKKLTPLLCAIECGAPDVVAKLLAMGAPPDRRGMTGNLTALYRCMSYVAWVWNPGQTDQKLRSHISSPPDLHRADAMRRYGVESAGVFGDGPLIESKEFGDAKNLKIFETLLVSEKTKILSRHTRSSLLTIAENLLRHDANPNFAHDYPIRGYTPLMLAAEEDAIEVFDLMLHYGGEPRQPDASGRNCMRIAGEFQSRRVMRCLQMRGIW
jgi:ankyrin repeat protein